MNVLKHFLGQQNGGDELYDIVILAPKAPIWPFLLWALFIFLFLGGVAIIVIHLLRSRSPIARTLSPQEKAGIRFRSIHQHLESLPVNEVMLETSDTLKDYLAEKYNDPLRFETAQEFLSRISQEDTKLPKAAQQELQGFLVASEEVKFGNTADLEKKSLTLIKAAENVVGLCQTINH